MGMKIENAVKIFHNTPIQFMLLQKSNEVMAYSYSAIYKLPCTGLRFLHYMVHGETRYGFIQVC